MAFLTLLVLLVFLVYVAANKDVLYTFHLWDGTRLSLPCEKIYYVNTFRRREVQRKSWIILFFDQKSHMKQVTKPRNEAKVKVINR